MIQIFYEIIVHNSKGNSKSILFLESLNTHFIGRVVIGLGRGRNGGAVGPVDGRRLLAPHQQQNGGRQRHYGDGGEDGNRHHASVVRGGGVAGTPVWNNIKVYWYKVTQIMPGTINKQ